jgi:hypothetical protein
VIFYRLGQPQSRRRRNRVQNWNRISRFSSNSNNMVKIMKLVNL